ncbi:ABC transporter permease [Microbacterium lacus]|uniref:ABC transporter permease n=1 Tax=Microbacterium lacus TaxID=415217 RepID=UPI000C2C96F9|nr:iron ABC transporter permease [Microbacterium lacus]
MPVSSRTRAPLPLIAVAGFSALLAAIPLIYLGVRIADAGIDGVLAVFARPRLGLLLANTLLLAASVTVASTLLGIAGALVLSRVRLPFSRTLAVLAVLPLAVPSYLAAFGWLAAIPGASGFWPSWLVLTVVTTPYVLLPVAAALRGTSATLSEVARTLGYGPVRTFLAVGWPGIRSSAVAGALLVCLYVLADFGGVALFRFPVLTTAIHQAYGASFDRNYAAVLAAVLVTIALVIFLIDRRARPSREIPVSRSAARARVNWGGLAPLAMAIVAAPAVLAVGVPLASLIARLVNAQTVRELDLAGLVQASATTIALSAVGAVIAVLLALPIATIAARFAGRTSRILEAAGSLPLAIPGIVVGLGLVFFSLLAVPALYQSAAMLAFAYGVLFLPKAIGTIRSSIERVPRELEEVASSLGYAAFRQWWHVTARLARPGIVVATLFITVTAMKELPATLMLRPTGTNTLAMELWSKTDVAAYGAAVPYALALVLLAAVPAVMLSPRSERLSTGRER